MQEFIKTTIKQAGLEVLKRFNQDFSFENKSDASDFVTEADLASEKVILDAIRSRYPDHGIIAEESGEDLRSSDYVWIVDPLDGTNNFKRKSPFFGVMMGVAKGGEMLMSAMYDPVHDMLFFAEKGKGALLNDKPCYASTQKTWSHSYGCGSGRLSSKKANFVKNLMAKADQELFWLNLLGSTAASAMLVADGRRDWYFSSGNMLWDYAPISLVLKEAGYIVTNSKGEDWKLDDRDIAVANEHLHKELLKIVNGA